MKKANIVREVRVIVVYPHLYHELNAEGEPVLDDAGAKKPTKFIYTFAVQRKADADLADSEAKLAGGKKFSSVEKLARLLTKDPEGFEDFPTDGGLSARVLAYFSEPGMEDFAEDALLARANAVFPAQLFRES